MRLYILGFRVLAFAGFSTCIGTNRSDRAALRPLEPVRVVTVDASP